MKRQLPYGQSDYGATLIVELRLALGEEAADKFGRALAGRREYIPKAGTEKHALFCEQFGEDIANFVADFAGGSDIDFPSLNSIEKRARLIARQDDLANRSITSSELAHKWGVSRRWVSILRRDLFATEPQSPSSGKAK